MAVIRDFSSTAKQAFLRCIQMIEIGNDNWNVLVESDLSGKYFSPTLIDSYSQIILSYQHLVKETSYLTREALEGIFSNAYAVESDFSVGLEALAGEVDSFTESIRGLLQIINPGLPLV